MLRGGRMIDSLNKHSYRDSNVTIIGSKIVIAVI